MSSATGYRRWKRCIGYAVAKAMKIGQIPRNDEGFDAYLWEPGLPKPLQVDAGNDAQADREGLKLGITNRAILAQKNHGLHYTEIDRQRAQELRDLIAEAEAISQEHPKISFDRALELLEQRSPNPIMQNQGQGRPQTSEPKAKASGMTFNVADPRPRHWKFERNEAGEVTGLLTEENQ